ncbi:DUF485 domain-containing protein [Quadrisphaera sp. GCM10027208]|uniref:DUF485 domain-containing protein n=1 Tax=Quadrisphaera sp. GCM10027208 TaxID=3273423 RepID=UPI00360B62F1
MSDQRRVRVTSPRMRAVRRPPTRSVARDIDEQTSVGEVFMRSLVRTQRRLALATLAAFALTVGALPLLFAVAPALRTAQVLGVPVPWLLLGLLVYPFVAVVAWAYVRAAERAERDFTDLVDRR